MKNFLALLPMLTLAMSCNQFAPSSSEFADTASVQPPNSESSNEQPGSATGASSDTPAAVNPIPEPEPEPESQSPVLSGSAPVPVEPIAPIAPVAPIEPVVSAPEVSAPVAPIEPVVSAPEVSAPVAPIEPVVSAPEYSPPIAPDAPLDPAPENDSPVAPVVISPVPDLVNPLPPKTQMPEVCVDMTNEASGNVQNGYGVIGKIYDASAIVATSFSQVKEKGNLLDEKIYLSGLNFSRALNPGFKRLNGTYILNSQGTNLIKNYGLELDSSLALDADDEEGYYQISVIADDGVIIEAGNEVLISADHNTPTKFSCLHKKYLIKMEKGKHIPLKVKFYQGSQNQLALILMWRKVKDLDGKIVSGASDQDLHEKRCGQAGNQFFFDLNSGVHPTMDYQDLLNPLKRAIPWRIVKHKNTKLPSNATNNVCD